MDFMVWLAKQGFDAETLSDTQRTVLQAAWRAEHNPAPTAGGAAIVATTYDALMEQFKAEQVREREVTALAAAALQDHPEAADKIDQIARLAIAGKWSAKDTELALLRGLRPTAPGPRFAGRGGDVSAIVLEAAMARTAGLDSHVLEKMYSEQTLEAADRQFRGGLSIGELVLSFARRNGYADASIRSDLMRTLQFAFREPQASTTSSYSLSGILGAAANKFVKVAFMAVEQEWRKVTAIRSVRDFKEITSYSLIGDYDYKEIAPSGKLEHAVPDEISYTNKAKSYGRFLGISRTDLINDDLNAFSTANKRLGRGGATKLNKVFWTEYNVISSFNTVGNGNYLAGGSSAFGSDSLTAADTLFRQQTQPDGEPLGVEPKQLVVGPANRIPARRLMASQQSMEDTDEGSNNPHAGAYEVVCSSYFANTTLGGVSTRWALQADPNDVPCIETCFLDGREEPVVEGADLDSDMLGIGMRAYHDFGVRKQEYRGKVVFAGA